MQLLTIPETATKIRMSESWLRQKVFEKQIRVVRIGRRVFISQETIDELLSGSIVEPRKVH
jgi:excisionase family DNA binding protein